MAVYTVHEPPPKQYESVPDPDRFAFVRDGFSIPAFLFGPLWMLWHRMWVVLGGYVIVGVALEAAFRGLGVSSGVRVAAGLLLALLIGFEAPTLRRFTLARRRFSNRGIIMGDDLEAAERRFFEVWTRELESRAAAAPWLESSSAVAHSETDVVGLFPAPGGNR